jgi:thiamine-phosphate diphosphorylase
MPDAKLPLPCLMLIVDPSVDRQAIIQAIDGGVDCIQLRGPDASPETMRSAALMLKSITSGRALLIVNNEPEIVHDLSLDGLHLPEQARLKVDAAANRRFLIGRSAHSAAAAVRAATEGADYIIAGTIFETGTHPGRDGAGLEFLSEVCRSVPIPVLAIGGVTPENISNCIEAGACGAAVISGILAADDPAAAAQRYASAILPSLS